MIARYSNGEKLFRVRADFGGLNLKKFERNLSFIFDTGAAHTIVSSNSLFTSRMRLGIHGLSWDSLGMKSIITQSFSGSIDQCYELCLRNVRISGLLFDRFYCYVMPDSKSNTAVLGLDFLSCCKFDWRFGENFRFDIDFDRYYKTHDDADTLSSTHVLLNQLSLA